MQDVSRLGRMAGNLEMSKSPVSAASMDTFVRKLFQETRKLETLTQRIVRQQYLKHVNVSSIDRDAKALLKQIVQLYVEELRKQQQQHEFEAEATEDGGALCVHENQENEEAQQMGQKTDVSCPGPRSEAVHRSPDCKQGNSAVQEGCKKRWLNVEQAREMLLRTPSKCPLKVNNVPRQPAPVKALSAWIASSPASGPEEQTDRWRRDLDENYSQREKKWQRVSSSEVRETLMCSDVDASDVSDLDSDSESDDLSVVPPAMKTNGKISESESDGEQWKPFTPAKDLPCRGAEDFADSSHSEAQLEELCVCRGLDDVEDVYSPVKARKRHKATRKRILTSDSDEEEEDVEKEVVLLEEWECEPPLQLGPKKKQLKGPKCRWKFEGDSQAPSYELKDAKLNMSCVVKVIDCSIEKLQRVNATDQGCDDSNVSASEDEGVWSTSGMKLLPEQIHKKGLLSTDSESESSEKHRWRKSATERHRGDTLPSSSDSESDGKPAVGVDSVGKSRLLETVPPPEQVSDSGSDGGMRLAVTAGKKDPRGHRQGSSSADAANKRLKHLERIARVSGVMPFGRGITLLYADCKNTNQRIRKVKEILEKAGMEGRPDLKKAERLRVKREAAELDMKNIINSEGRSRRRNVFSTYATQQMVLPSPDHSRQESTNSVKNTFSRLRGIVDSDSDSD